MAQSTLPYKPKMSKMTFCPTSDNSEESDIEEHEVTEPRKVNGGLKDEETAASTIAQESEEESEESFSDAFDSDPEAEMYSNISATTMGLDMIVKFPTLDDIIYETSCCTCWDDRGPFIFSCASGHAVCTPCFQLVGRKGVCQVEIVDSPNNAVKCGGRFYEIDEAIKNTPYYKNFMQAYQCERDLPEMGCNIAVVPGASDVVGGDFGGDDRGDDEQHEQHEQEEECDFRFLKYCGYRAAENCKSTFKSLVANLVHLIEKHNLPVNFSPARFMVRYDRREFMGDQVGPLIRGAVETKGKEYYGLLMAADWAGNKTRLWLVNYNNENELDRLTATIHIYPPTWADGDWKHKKAQSNSIVAELAVVPDMKNMFRLESTTAGLAYYVDLDNEKLDKTFCVNKDGKKYFGVMVVLPDNDLKRNAALQRIPRSTKSIDFEDF